MPECYRPPQVGDDEVGRFQGLHAVGFARIEKDALAQGCREPGGALEHLDAALDELDTGGIGRLVGRNQGALGQGHKNEFEDVLHIDEWKHGPFFLGHGKGFLKICDRHVYLLTP